ncbi:MAG: TonB-dependent receptor [Saprospiraceae bacterium]|nr:TonB-dependent receptor [Saprospiraceae bacterium]
MEKHVFNQLFGQKIATIAVVLLLAGNALTAQRVTGKITDRGGESLTGATVVIKNTSKGTVTDANGHYALEASPADILVFSYTGFTLQEIAVGSRTTIDVVLAESAESLDEVIVTGVFDPRTRLEASVAISTLNARQIERLSATSSADLLKNIPGVYVNQARGEVSNTVYSRGISAGSIDNINGYYYVSMQEDGLPVTNINLSVDGYLRADATTNRVEAVRGGSACILGANAPGGIFNYASKTGGKTFAGEVRARFGLEGDGKNPYYRADVNFGGPLNKAKDLTYNIGGFYRQSDGARYPGYPMNNGGQVKANVLKTYQTGSLKLYAKILNDKNAAAEFIPTQGWTDPKIPSGFSATDSYYLPDVSLDLPVNADGTLPFKSKDKSHFSDNAFGLSWTQQLGNGFTFKNDGRYSSKNSTSNIPAVVTPFATDGFLFYAIPGLLGRFGTYTFTDKVTGQVLGTVTQAPRIINGQFAGFEITPGDNNNFPGENVQKNSLFFLPLFYSKNEINEVMDQFSVSKKISNMNFVLGGFYGHSKATIVGTSQDWGIGVGTLQHQPHLTDITLAGFDGQTYQVTDPNGFMDVGRDGANLSTTTQNQFALFFGHDWQINSDLNFDWGLRYENTGATGTNTRAIPNPRKHDPTYGGLDGNPLTLYDNGGGTEGTPLAYDHTISTLSFSGGLNYKLSNTQAIYLRYSNGNKAPDVNFYLGLTSPFAIETTPVSAQKVQQIEAGYKVSSERVKLFVTPFYSLLSNVPNIQTFTDTNGLNYSPTYQFAKYTTVGVEVEATYAFTAHFSVRAGATVQNSKATEFKTWLANDNGRADDVLIDYSGNETDNNAKVIFNINPTYSTEKFYSSLNFSYMGARQANVPNAFRMPGFGILDLALGYDLTKNFSLQLNVNNLLNTYGVLGWSGPGGFPAALDRQGFSKAFVDANPNAIYSTQAAMPRAYFLTAAYKI